MRGLLRVLRSAMRRMRQLMASVSSVALVAVRGVDGALSWIWQAVAGSPVPEVEEAFDEPMQEEEPAEKPDELFHANLGDLVLRAAGEVLRHGEVLSGDIPVGIKTWLENLDRGDLFELVRYDARTVGRHTAGVECVLGVAGEPLRTPDGAEDRSREERRQELKQKRRLEHEAAAARRRREAEVVNDRQPSLLPGLAA